MSDFVYFVTDYIFHKLRLSAFLKNKINEMNDLGSNRYRVVIDRRTDRITVANTRYTSYASSWA